MVLPLGSTSCSEPDEPGPGGGGEDTIAFTNPSGREAVTTLSIKEFEVWAFTEPWNTAIMRGVDVRRTGLNSWTYSPVTKWPENPVDFYAVSPMGMKVDINIPHSRKIVFPMGDGKTDLLVAVKMGAVQSDGHIRLNFCHTLARVTASISTTLSDTIVRVKRIAVMDVGNQGDYTIPLKTTVKDEPADEISDAWEVYNMSATRYDLFATERATELLTLSSDPFSISGMAEFFIPVMFNPLTTDGGYLHGSSIEVAYQLYSRATGHKIWPTEDTDKNLLVQNMEGWGAARFPLLNNTPEGRWYAGREYHYDISIKGPASLNLSRSSAEEGNSIETTVGRY